MLDQNTIINSTSPVVELLSDLDNIDDNWKKLAKNKQFINQLTQRRKLNTSLDLVISNLPRPDMSLQEAVSSGYLTESQISDLYSLLSDLLEGQPEYQRIILYLPFEFLPNIKWLPVSVELQTAILKFRMAYMSAWYNLLSIQDVRANFVDGDVLDIESRTGDLPRVIKAAHLIPKLIEVGFIGLTEVYRLMDVNDNEIFCQSFEDAIAILSIKETRVEKLKSRQITLSLVDAIISQEIAKIASEKYFGITSGREKWLREIKVQKLVETLGSDICLAIIENNFSINMAWQFTSASYECCQALIAGIRKAIVLIAKTNKIQAQEIYNEYFGLLVEFWSSDNYNMTSELTKTFYHWYQLGIMPIEDFKSFNLVIPTLAGPFSDNLPSMVSEIDYLKETVSAIVSDEWLSKYIYPVVLLFGSRLKGYGSQSSDIDVAVFIKPEISFTDSKNIELFLAEIFDHHCIRGQVVQFWLEHSGFDLKIRDLSLANSLFGESNWVHVLFGAVWIGDQLVIDQLREELIIPYFYNQDKELLGWYLESLERDLLQYRLMHKGYQKFFPAISNLEQNRIDGQSYFWDSGYRQIAIRLFSQMVFIPQISQIKEKK